MKWFDRWFMKHSQRAWENARQLNDENVPRIVTKPSDDLSGRQAATIRIHDAHGGKVVEISSWDDHRDRHNRELYIVHDGAELGSELTSIIVQHSLRN